MAAKADAACRQASTAFRLAAPARDSSPCAIQGTSLRPIRCIPLTITNRRKAPWPRLHPFIRSSAPTRWTAPPSTARWRPSRRRSTMSFDKWLRREPALLSGWSGRRLGEFCDGMPRLRPRRLCRAVVRRVSRPGREVPIRCRWDTLKYDTSLEGYVVSLSKDQLEGAPAYDRDQTPEWGIATMRSSVHDFYGVPPYWQI